MPNAYEIESQENEGRGQPSLARTRGGAGGDNFVRNKKDDASSEFLVNRKFDKD